MSLQLLALAIYNKNGERRVVNFRPGKLNIITGKSLTGKSSLIHIVDYCLGRTTFEVFSGVITDNVVWYVLHVLLPNGQAIIGRPAPLATAVTTAVYFETGGELTIPEFAALRQNSNTAALEDFLSNAIGIKANENVPPAGQTRPPLRANISHARFLLFQPQGVIADKDALFYRQKEQFIPQAIKDTLPYFLGATGDDQFDRLQRYRRLQKELRLRERRLEDELSVRGRENDRAVALIAEARNAGLMSSSGAIPDDFDEAVNLLKVLGKSTVPPDDESDQGGTLNNLQEIRDNLYAELRSTQGEIDAANAFVSAQNDFNVEATDQKNRLTAINLFREEPTNNRCPLCEHDLSERVPKAEAIRANLSNLERQITTATREQPRLTAFLAQREEHVADLKRQLRENKAAIDALLLQEEALQQERNRYVEQARVAGRISLFLESARITADDGELRAEIEDLKRQVLGLEDGLFGEAVDDQLASILQIVGLDMSAWAKELELEHSEWPIGFDIKNLTVIAYRKARPPVRLPLMGGGKNWMGYHVVAMLALHKLFRETNRPVPGLLMLDQPTQVFFPSELKAGMANISPETIVQFSKEVAEDRSVDELKDEDQEAVHRLFKLIYDFTVNLAPNMQVIVTDHADLAEDWFQEAVVERWRGNDKLVPPSWYETSPTPSNTDPANQPPPRDVERQDEPPL